MSGRKLPRYVAVRSSGISASATTVPAAASAGSRTPDRRAIVVPRDELRLLTVAQVAPLLGLTRKGVYGLVETRRIPCVRVPSRGRRHGPIRFVLAELLAWLEQNRVPTLE